MQCTVVSLLSSALCHCDMCWDDRTWEDIAWIASITDMPVVLKGISSPEDAVIAAEMSVEGARKNASFVPFFTTKNDRFTKTGSGQAYGDTQNK